MSTPPRAAGAPVAPQVRDELAPLPVSASETVFTGRIWDVVRDTVELDGGPVVREYQRHPGAVGILALDDEERVLLLHQYRHPVRHLLWEPPAGLLDVEGEHPHAAAVRELAEEADLRAGTWHVLMDWFNSPGGSDEAFRLFLARDLTPVPEAERHVREHEEASMTAVWVPLDEARDAVLEGRLANPTAVAGVLAAWSARAAGWSGLRPVDAPWLRHRAYR
ncbi:NUDIX hydrolase [Quadrisphaera sp. DSM 44207]|uniref:NUDIX domain-containing protein n=1 Tax=Quadrisphaera sp. DSM 44207 TaxID=1881057 RepID=UPI00088BDB41|nr:NUDIX hydrolase [Quadrisphaera sp. DSM 44207]SDQ50995.1 ADP-ribose pyrophosphatase [Quadrisphaera sp. DSM 44207]